MTMRTKAVGILAAACLAFLAGGARAQTTPDHLKCYKIKDPAQHVLYSATLTGLRPEQGCRIKVPGSLLCVAATKTNVSPPPPGGGPSGTNAGMFVCYKVKCPKVVLPAVSVRDQFATHSFTPSVAKLLCAPAVRTTTTTTPTTTTAHPTTTTAAGATTTTAAGATTTTAAAATTTTAAAATTTTAAGGTTTTTSPVGNAACTQSLPNGCGAACDDPAQVCSLVFNPATGGVACTCVTGTVACAGGAGTCSGSAACPGALTGCQSCPSASPCAGMCACF